MAMLCSVINYIFLVTGIILSVLAVLTVIDLVKSKDLCKIIMENDPNTDASRSYGGIKIILKICQKYQNGTLVIINWFSGLGISMILLSSYGFLFILFPTWRQSLLEKCLFVFIYAALSFALGTKLYLWLKISTFDHVALCLLLGCVFSLILPFGIICAIN